MTDLKPCPFCGSNIIHVSVLWPYHVKCRRCNVRTDDFEYKVQAIDMWNYRVKE